MDRIKFFLRLALLILPAILSSCSDDLKYPSHGPEGSLNGMGESRSTVFHILEFPDNVFCGEVTFELCNPSDHLNLEFPGSVLSNPEMEIMGKRGALTCRMAIGEREVPDGRYLLTVKVGDNHSVPFRLLKFENNVAAQEEYDPLDYSDLEGTGTENDPYLINNPGDFLSLQYWLQKDEYEGYGRYFKITRGFELPRRSQIIDGRTWAAVCFQGNLDGDGHTLRNLAYTGGSDATKDSGVGLFKSLFNADVRNLKLSGALITNAASQVGLIAGSSGGKTTLSDIAVEGTIQAVGDSVGGIIGSAGGEVTLSGITVNTLSVIGNNHVGLLIGGVSDAALAVSDVSTPGHIFSVNGNDCVGGVAGTIDRCSEAAISNVTFEHSVDAESSDVKVISGNGHVGGIAGKVSGVGNINIARCSVKAPISGGNQVGALIGESIASELTFDSNLLASVVRGKDCTGGFAGRIDLSGKTLAFTGNNRYVVKQSAEAGVSGHKGVGALAGNIEGNGKIDLKGNVELAVNVSGSDGDVGGAVGLLNGSIDFDISNLNFSSPTMRIKGAADGVGGVVGWSNNARIYASTTLDVSNGLPWKSQLTSNCGVVVTGASTVGGIVGVAAGGSLRGLVSDAVVTATSATGHDYGSGGVVGSCSADISECAFMGKVAGTLRVGGVAGLLNTGKTIENCVNYSDIESGSNQGGVIGYMRSSTRALSHIRLCANDGNLTGGVVVGGIVGSIGIDHLNEGSRERTYLEWCFNTGDIVASGNADHPVGGIIGQFWDDWACIRYCTNHGDVSSTNVAYAIGGIVGEIGDKNYENQTTVYECFNGGRINCDVASTKLGGIVGHIHSGGEHVGKHNSTIHDCVNTGSIPPDQKDDTGGIVGMVTTSTDTYRTFNRGMVSHGNAIIGTHKGGTIFYHDHNYYLEGTGKSWPSSTSVKKEKITDETVYKEFDFDKIWKMTEYGPTLRNIIL